MSSSSYSFYLQTGQIRASITNINGLQGISISNAPNMASVTSGYYSFDIYGSVSALSTLSIYGSNTNVSTTVISFMAATATDGYISGSRGIQGNIQLNIRTSPLNLSR